MDCHRRNFTVNDTHPSHDLGAFFNERHRLKLAVAGAKQAEQAAPPALQHRAAWATAEALGHFQTHQSENALMLRAMLADAEATGGAVLDTLAEVLATRLGLQELADAVAALEAGRAA